MTDLAYDYIILSPHFDDAVFSCGGDVARRTAAGQRVLIVTIMAGEPPPGPISAYAGSLQTRWELLQEAVAARRAEDARACEHLGADWRHWDVPDCIYRRHPISGETFYNSDAGLFGEIHPADRELITRLSEDISRLWPAQPGELAVPLAVGGHVDHQITRAAAERLNRPLVYFEDYPYAQEPGALEKVIPAADPRWRARVIPLKPDYLNRKIEAIRHHASQLSTFFANDADLVARVTDFSTRVGGERVWIHEKLP